MNTAIAQHLNVVEDAILEVQEWARVLWVRVKGLGCRFVSKKVAKKMELAELEGSEKQVKWAKEIRANWLAEAYQTKEKFEQKIVDAKHQNKQTKLNNVTEKLSNLLKVIERLEKETDATWFIDNRRSGIPGFINNQGYYGVIGYHEVNAYYKA